MPPARSENYGADWLDRFQAMVDELRSDPEIRVVQYRLNPPVTPQDLSDVETELGVALADPIRSFYQAADGVQLRWLHRRSPCFEEARHAPSDRELTVYSVLDDDGRCHGCLNLRPLREVFLEADWEGQIWFPDMAEYEPVELAGKTYPSLEFHRSIRIFDYFHFFRQAAFLVRPRSGSPRVLIGDEAMASWTEAGTLTFEAYMETVLAQRALCESRKGPFHNRGYWSSHPVPLKKLVGRLELLELPAGMSLAELTEAMKSRSPKKRLAVLEQLAEHGEQAVPLLERALRDKLPALRRAAAEALTRPVPLLRALLEDSDREVRGAAILALTRLGGLGPDDLSWLRPDVLDPDEGRAALAIEAVCQLAGSTDAAVPLLIEAVEKARRSISCRAARRLGELGERAQGALSVLVEALDDEVGFGSNEPSRASGAVLALCRLGPPPQALGALERLRRSTMGPFQQIEHRLALVAMAWLEAPRPLARLLDQLESFDSADGEADAQLAQALCLFEEDAARWAPKLLDFIATHYYRDPNGRATWAGLQALKSMGPGAATALLARIAQPEPHPVYPMEVLEVLALTPFVTALGPVLGERARPFLEKLARGANLPSLPSTDDELIAATAVALAAIQQRMESS